MAGRTPLSVLQVSRFTPIAFLAPSTVADVANGNVAPNDGATALAVFNSDAAVVHNLTVGVAAGVDGLTAGPRPYPIPISSAGVQFFGPFPIVFYGPQLLLNADNAQLKIFVYSLLGP